MAGKLLIRLAVLQEHGASHWHDIRVATTSEHRPFLVRMMISHHSVERDTGIDVLILISLPTMSWTLVNRVTRRSITTLTLT